MSSNSTAVSEDTGLLWRIVALIVLIAIADLWTFHHLGLGIRSLVVPAGLAAALGVAVKFANWIYGEAPVKSALQPVRERGTRLLNLLITRGTLAGSGVLLFSAMLTISSVTMVSEGDNDTSQVSVTALDAPTKTRSASLGGARQIERFVVATTPFGRLFRVEAAGYMAETFAVFPPVGRHVRLGSDLRVLPPILFRPNADGLGHLEDGAVLRVLRLGAAEPEVLVEDTGHAGSFMLGRARAIPPAMIDDWKNELVAMTAPDALIADMVLKWKSPRRLAAQRALALGDNLRAELWIHDTLVGRGDVILAGESLIDVRMEGVVTAETH
jgi:hypothetical protein